MHLCVQTNYPGLCSLVLHLFIDHDDDDDGGLVALKLGQMSLLLWVRKCTFNSSITRCTYMYGSIWVRMFHSPFSMVACFTQPTKHIYLMSIVIFLFFSVFSLSLSHSFVKWYIHTYLYHQNTSKHFD